MKKILKKLNVLLDKRQKTAMTGLVFMMIVSAFLQTAGVGMLVNVVNVAVDSDALESNRMVARLYDFLGFTDYRSFSVAVMVLLILVFAVKNLFLFLQQKLTLHFVYTNQFRTSERMMRNYMRRGYEFFLNADTAVVQRSITSDVNNMYALILALLTLVSDGVMSLFVITYCFLTNGTMTLLLGGVLVILMVLVKCVMKPIMYKAGKDNQDYYSGLFKWISQTVQGIKEIKVGGRERYFVEEYKKCGKGYVNAVRKYSLYNATPKLLMETACVGAMVGYMIFLVVTGTSTENMLGVLTTLAAAAFVLLPSVNRINNQLTSIAYFEPFFMGVSDNLQDEIAGEKVDMSFATEEEERLPVQRSIELKNITYAYPNTDKLIFSHADMVIPVGASVGIVGTTGAGKSTLADILLGLLDVREGTICADGVDIRSNYRRWLKNIGYIPQMIFMLDDTIRRNVAFGIADEKISEDRVWAVLKEAQLDEFIRSLPDGLDTVVGERGIRLSGGQRQRISIARALYHDPEVLVLDEATSSLDNDTEKAIMDSINLLQGRKTLIIIAHRLQTIEKCDIVYRVQDGKIWEERNSAG
ncbi:MAG: ABC transporter ATP-binding protein/permease [Firmicutes bacterium]|nr:ABC transporter ATP-binding protein/permease [Bacillota bacterium]